MSVLSRKEERISFGITAFLVLLLLLFFFLPAFIVEHPTKLEEELEMVELPFGFSVNSETGGGSSDASSEEAVQEQVTEEVVAETQTTPNKIETQTQESSLDTPPPPENANDNPEPEPPKAKFAFPGSSSSNPESTNGSGKGGGGNGKGGISGGGLGSGKDGYNGPGIGGSLEGRKMLNPKPLKASCPISKTEVVVLSVRVNKTGKVIDVKTNWTKSKTSNQCLIDFATSYAKGLKWNTSNIPEQVGTLTFNFKP